MALAKSGNHGIRYHLEFYVHGRCS
jgi:hypothetical protein